MMQLVNHYNGGRWKVPGNIANDLVYFYTWAFIVQLRHEIESTLD